MTTPESKVKTKIKILLTEYGVYYFMPVQMGYGAAGVDFHCVLPGGLAFFVEAKAPSGTTTDRQDALLNKFTGMGIQVFVVDDDQSLRKLRTWLAMNALVALNIPMVKIN